MLNIIKYTLLVFTKSLIMITTIIYPINLLGSIQFPKSLQDKNPKTALILNNNVILREMVIPTFVRKVNFTCCIISFIKLYCNGRKKDFLFKYFESDTQFNELIKKSEIKML